MGADTSLRINSKYGIEDIITVIKSYGNVKEVKWESTHSPNYHTLLFNYRGEDRMLHIHTNYNSPIGSCTLMSFRHNTNGVELLNKVANVFGGFFEENDCDGNIEMFDGALSESNWIPYFVRYAILNNKMNKQNELEALEQLRDCIKEWKNKINQGR